MVIRNPEGYLREYSNALESQFQVKISTSQLSRFLAERDICRKVVSPSRFITDCSLQRKRGNGTPSFVPTGLPNHANGEQINSSSSMNQVSTQNWARESMDGDQKAIQSPRKLSHRRQTTSVFSLPSQSMDI
jgi:hypothetical protein